MVIPIIKDMRKKAGLTQMELAKKLGVVQSAVATWESGEGYPAASRLIEIAAALNCTVDDLLREPTNQAS